jgi:site-specific DNA-adenine methylase
MFMRLPWGSTLYTNFYEHADHERLAGLIESLERPWVLTYDNADEIRKMYERFDQYLFSLNYSVAAKRKGKGRYRAWFFLLHGWPASPGAPCLC